MQQLSPKNQILSTRVKKKRKGKTTNPWTLKVAIGPSGVLLVMVTSDWVAHPPARRKIHMVVPALLVLAGVKKHLAPLRCEAPTTPALEEAPHTLYRWAQFKKLHLMDNSRPSTPPCRHRSTQEHRTRTETYTQAGSQGRGQRETKYSGSSFRFFYFASNAARFFCNISF